MMLCRQIRTDQMQVIKRKKINKETDGVQRMDQMQVMKRKKNKQSNQWSQRRKIMQASRQHNVDVRLPNCENLYIIIVFVRSST